MAKSNTPPVLEKIRYIGTGEADAWESGKSVLVKNGSTIKVSPAQAEQYVAGEDWERVTLEKAPAKTEKDGK